MADLKERFSDFVEALNTVVIEGKNGLLHVEDENNKKLQAKTELHLNNQNKMVENLEKRIEKHEASILKSKSSHKTKVDKSTKSHKAKLKQIDATKEKNLQLIQKEFKNEKAKLSDGLKDLEKNYLKEEANCLNEIERLRKNANAYNVETLVTRKERKAKKELNKIQNQLDLSLSKELNYPENIKSSIDRLKHIQAALEINKIEHDSRVEKLECRIIKEDLVYQAEVGNIKQNKLREETKSRYDLDKICMNYAYNITHEALKVNQDKVDLDYKIADEEQMLQYFKDTQELLKDRDFQLEDEKVALENIIQKDFIGKIKNDFDLSDKEHHDLFEFEKAMKNYKDVQNGTNYNLSIEEIDQRMKHQLERVKLLVNQLKDDLNTMVSKVKANLKIELKMPEKQIKTLNQKYKSEGNKLAKLRDRDLQDIQSQLSLLDPSFDQSEIKSLNIALDEIEKQYQRDAKKLEDKYNKELLAYNNKIEYANKRAEKTIAEATKLYDSQVTLYNDEINFIKKNAEREKNRAKKLSESIKALNNEYLQVVQGINELAVNQNKELVDYLVGFSEVSLDMEKTESENKKANLELLFNDQVNEKEELLNKNKAEYKEALKALDSKLDAYKKTINKKMESEQKDIQKISSKLDKQLKKDLSDLTKKYENTHNLFKVAIKDSELEYNKQNKVLTKEQSLLIKQIEILAEKEQVKLNVKDYDIYYDADEEEEKIVEKPSEVETLIPSEKKL